MDFEKRVIHIQRKDFWLPKSLGKVIRERDIAMTDELVVFLKKHKLKDRQADNWVFHNRYGEQLKSGLRKILARITQPCAIPMLPT